MAFPYLIPRALAALADGTAKHCACGDHLGHRLVEVRWFDLAIGEICIDCGAVDYEWTDGKRCTGPLDLGAPPT